MNILTKINSPADLKQVPEAQLGELAQEIRDFLIEHISKTGGHFASNLGTVELTIALDRVYNPEIDRIVFDVGHQAYVHKLLTGRRDDFDTLRQFGGMSGFPKPKESRCDAFITGHASTSISAALGMARARTIQGRDYDVCAVIGDGSMTGGLAYEAAADAGQSGEPMVVILNDNAMSISESVGGIANMLSDMRTREGYFAFKRIYHHTIGKITPVYNTLHRFKQWLKKRLLPNNVFSDMGFYYLGPINGHDEQRLEQALRYARDMNCPVLLHVLTQKGRGYQKAVEQPNLYHGVGPFDPAEGLPNKEKVDFSAIFGKTLCDLAAADPTVVGITAAMEDGTGMNGFAKTYPERFFDVGICEEHAVTMSSGMASQGLKPVFAVYSGFLQRSYDMLIHDVSLSQQHVILGVDRAGLVGADGETHHGVFDVTFLRSVPGMTVLAPASYAELEALLRVAVSEITGPVAIRYPRGGEGAYKDCHPEAEALLREGSDLTIVSYGILINEALEAAEALRAKGISAEVVKLSQLQDFSMPCTMDSIRKTGRVIVVEETCQAGAMGERILALCEENGLHLQSGKLLNLQDGIVPHGTVSELRHYCGIDATGIAATAEQMMNEEKK